MPTDLKALLKRFVNLDVDEPDKRSYTSAGLGPVIDPVTFALRYTSPSQMERFDPDAEGGCERKWWFRYRARIPDKKTKAKDLGTQVHAQVEHYLKTGEDVLGELARAGKRFIPLPGPDLLVESECGVPAWPGPLAAPVMSELRTADVPLVLKIDLMHRRGFFLTEDGELVAEPGPTVEVRDWKTSKQINDVFDEETGIREARGYAKQGADLLSTWQMPAYGEVGRLRFPDVEYIRLSHGYFQSQGKREGALRSALHPVQDVVTRWQQSAALVERMKIAAKIPKAEDVPANTKSCMAFGGCPYRQQCPRDPKAVLEEMLGGGMAARLMTRDKVAPVKMEVPMSLLARMNKTPAATPPADPLAAEKAKLLAEEAALRSGSITAPDAPPPTPVTFTASCGHTVTAADSSRLPDGTIKHIGCQPVYRSQPSPTARAGEACPIGGTQIDCDIDVVSSKKYPCGCGAELKVKPTKMGSGYVSIAPKHDVPVDVGEKQPAAATETKTAETAPTKGQEELAKYEASLATLRPLTTVDLYAGAVEDGIAYKRLETYAQALADRLAASFNVPDVRAAVGESPVSFGKWKGLLAALAKTEPPAPGAYLVDPSSDFGMVVFEALATMGLGRVVRGIK